MADTTTPPHACPQVARPLTPITEAEPDVDTPSPGKAIGEADAAASPAGSHAESENAPTSPVDAGNSSCEIGQGPAVPDGADIEATGETSNPPTPSEVLAPSDVAKTSDTATTADDTTNPPNEITEAIRFHVDADLLVKIQNGNDKDMYYRVSSGNFACASTVWRLDLYGSTSNLRSSPDDALAVDIGTTCHKDAFVTLMDIVHYRFGDVPDEVELAQLYHITQLTEKFMCTHLIRPWATTWIQNKRMRDSLALDGMGDGMMSAMGAKVAWELGASSLLKSMGEVMIMTAIVGDDGDLVHGCHKKLKDLNLPPGMFETISSIRLSVVSKLLATIQRPYDNLASQHHFCQLHEHQDCDATMIGSLTMQLASHSLFPVPTVGTYRGTLRELEKAIAGLKLKRWEGKGIVPHLAHVGCNLGIANDAKAAMEGMQFPLEEPGLEHLESQRRLSGIPQEE